jgi:hypothetical protein
LGLACAACFEELAGVFASSGALHYAKILASLKIKNAISLTPLNCGQKMGCFPGREGNTVEERRLDEVSKTFQLRVSSFGTDKPAA